MFLFAGHDPGSKNHIRPIYNHALGLGWPCDFIDLSLRTELMDNGPAQSLVDTAKPRVFIGGCSMNQGEWALVRACKRLGIPAVVVVDLSAKSKLDPIDCQDFPDRFLVTNSGCTRELVNYGASHGTVVLTGSTHLEHLSTVAPVDVASQIRTYYGLASGENIVSFFGAPDTPSTIRAIASLAALLPETNLESPAVVLRPHPRSPDKHTLEAACRGSSNFYYDQGDVIQTSDLLRSSCFSLSMASTVSLESLVVGTPSAFYQVGWFFTLLDDLYNKVKSVPRIRTSEQLLQFVDNALKGHPAPAGDVERCSGALDRTWRAITELI